MYNGQDNEIRAQKAQDVARGTKNIVGSENDEVGTRKRGRESSNSSVARTTARVFIANFRSSLGTC